MEAILKRIEDQIEFIRETDKEKNILRQTYVGNPLRQENDAEHAWHLAVMTMVLAEYSNEPINVERVIKMVTIHDVVEIDAGDTYAYDPVANQSKRERELKAAERIFNMLPEDQAREMRGLWDEFEEAQTADAKFALAMDIFHPVIMNDFGGGAAWRDHFVTEEQVRTRIEKMRPGSEKLWEACVHIVERNLENGNIIKNEAEFK